jgi:hypothetical protein
MHQHHACSLYKQRSDKSSKLGSKPPKVSHKNSPNSASSSGSSELLLLSYLEDAVSDKEDVVSVIDDEVVIQGEDEVVSQEQEFPKLVSALVMIFAAGRGLDGSLLHSRLSIIRR